MKYAIAAGHEETARAAESILQEGGNAVDAAIAAFLMTWVCEPCMASAGGGGFAQIYTAERKSILLDFFCQTPRSKRIETREFFPIEVNFGDTQEHFHIGAASVAVPGSVAGLFALYDRFGQLPLELLFAPAIQAAKEGVAINRFQHLDFQLLSPILQHQEEGRQLFFQDGQLKPLGAIIKMPGLADYLEHLWREGARAFYDGEIATKIEAQQKLQGGYLRREDLLNYQVNWQTPSRVSFGDRVVLCNPAPHPGGQILRKTLRTFTQVSAKEANQSSLAQTLARVFIDSPKPQAPSPDQKHGSTTHFSIVDQWGNAISLTASNGEGSGYFIPDTDIQLNNMLGEAALLPNGFHTWPANTRLGSMMTPSMVVDSQGNLHLVTGSSGAGRIPYAIAQVIYHNQWRGVPLEEAVNGPRMHLAGQSLEIEPGFDLDSLHLPAPYQANLWSAPNLFFGGAHSVQVQPGALMAVPDRRRDGVVLQQNS